MTKRWRSPRCTVQTLGPILRYPAIAVFSWSNEYEPYSDVNTPERLQRRASRHKFQDSVGSNLTKWPFTFTVWWAIPAISTSSLLRREDGKIQPEREKNGIKNFHNSRLSPIYKDGHFKDVFERISSNNLPFTIEVEFSKTTMKTAIRGRQPAHEDDHFGKYRRWEVLDVKFFSLIEIFSKWRSSWHKF